MPILAVFAAGLLGGLWVRSEVSNTSGPLTWAAIAGAGFLAYKLAKRG